VRAKVVTNEKLVYSVPEVAELLDLSPGLVYQACKKHELPCLRIGKRYLVPVESLRRLLESIGSKAGKSKAS
jgi:excisionase family DNA binding protein